MARIRVIRGANLPNSATKDNVHELVDNSVANIYDIVNADIKAGEAIPDSKLANISIIGKVNLTALTITGQTAGDILYASSPTTIIRLPIGTAGQKLKVYNTVLDYMEYSSDANARAAYVPNTTGTGGTITSVAADKVHTFTSSGTFTPAASGTVAVLVVAGGGGGASGGGGGGGVIYSSSKAVVGGTGYTVTVGNGGAGAAASGDAQGTNGQDSVFGDLTALGGGGGGAVTDNSHYNGSNGGSGGGGGGGNRAGGSAGGTATQPTSEDGGFGYAGGTNSAQTGNPYPSGGGGGAGGVGENAPASDTSGDGGAGYTSTINGTSVNYAGGGGGGNYYGGAGAGTGTDGGGDGKDAATGGAGTANRGGGGGGTSTGYTGGQGGSGIVIIRYTPALQTYSESTIKTQGTYALKAIAAITTSLNKTLTRTIGSPLNLTDINTLKFSIRSSRTGSNIKIGIHDSGGTTTETTPNITAANTWQTVTWDISAVSNANKDAIDSIIITIVNADAANTFYIDHFHTNDGTTMLRWETP